MGVCSTPRRRRYTDQGRAEWVEACTEASLREGVGIRVQLPGGGKKDAVALFLHQGQLYALADRCCHADKSIHGGDIEDLGECVVSKAGDVGTGGACVQCPRHQRKFAGGLYFNLETGRACTPEMTKKFRKMGSHSVDVHDVKREHGRVFISALPRNRRNPRPSSSSSSSYSSEEQEGADTKRLRLQDLAASPHTWNMVLQGKDRVTHDSWVYILSHPAKAQLPQQPASPVWHVSLFAEVGGAMVEREYTPVSDWREWREKGTVRLLIKVYPDGIMTQHIHRLPLKASMLCSAPQATLLTPSFCAPGPELPPPDAPLHIVLLAAGTGVVPMLQVLTEAFQQPRGPRTATLVYSSRLRRDVICWDELRAISAMRRQIGEAGVDSAGHERQGHAPIDFRAWLAFSSPEDGDGGDGRFEAAFMQGIIPRRLDKDALASVLQWLPPQDPVHVVVSGPDGFFESMQKAIALERGAAVTYANLDS